MEKPIKIKSFAGRAQNCGHVRLTDEAETKLRELCRQSGLSARYIASQIILQSSDLVEFVEEGNDENN